MKTILFSILIGSLAVFVTSCNNDGCIDPTALNYDPKAEKDDGSCVYLNQNLNFQFNAKLGTQDFAYNTTVVSSSGRSVKITRAQMYLSGFAFNGSGGTYEIADSYLLIKPEVEDYSLGYLPAANYDGFSFSGGVDSASNHIDPATWPGTNALSSNNPDHMHWGWDPGYIFFVLEGQVDTTADMNGSVDAPFLFHVGTDMLRVDMAFVQSLSIPTDVDVNIEMDVDWLALLEGIDMIGDQDTRVTHVSDNPQLANDFTDNVDDAFSLH